MLNLISYDIFKYSCNKGGSLVEFLTEFPGHILLQSKAHHSSKVYAFSFREEVPGEMVLIFVISAFDLQIDVLK